MRSSPFVVAGAAAAVVVALTAPAAYAGPGQHGSEDGHLLGTGEWGKIELVGQVEVRSPSTTQRRD